MKKLLLILGVLASPALAQSPCVIGDYLFEDLSCGSKLIENKRPVAIVFSTEDRAAVSLVEEQKQWSTQAVNLEINPPKGFMQTKEDAIKETGGQELITLFEAQAPNFYPAVMYCASINQIGYRYWYLPEMGLVNKIYQNKDTINNALEQINEADELSINTYWSASQYSYSQAWQQYFFNGFIGYQYNDKMAIARCVINY